MELAPDPHSLQCELDTIKNVEKKFSFCAERYVLYRCIAQANIGGPRGFEPGVNKAAKL